jgi:hypothetical protein
VYAPLMTHGSAAADSAVHSANLDGSAKHEGRGFLPQVSIENGCTYMGAGGIGVVLGGGGTTGAAFVSFFGGIR